jgi:hypothetical protein
LKVAAVDLGKWKADMPPVTYITVDFLEPITEKPLLKNVVNSGLLQIVKESRGL